MECQTCSGRRFVIKQEPRIWRQNGVSCVMGLQTTGISHLCDDCQGTGIGLDPAHDPDCVQCHGTGQRNAWVAFGEYETEPCQCTAPIEALEVA